MVCNNCRIQLVAFVLHDFYSNGATPSVALSAGIQTSVQSPPPEILWFSKVHHGHVINENGQPKQICPNVCNALSPSYPLTLCSQSILNAKFEEIYLIY